MSFPSYSVASLPFPAAHPYSHLNTSIALSKLWRQESSLSLVLPEKSTLILEADNLDESFVIEQ